MCATVRVLLTVGIVDGVTWIFALSWTSSIRTYVSTLAYYSTEITVVRVFNLSVCETHLKLFFYFMCDEL